MKKFNIITHITTACNFDCSYCDVVKDGRNLSEDSLSKIVNFVERNQKQIWRFKFFWWEPLIAFRDMKRLIKDTQKDIWRNYEIVTNTSLLKPEIWEYFEQYFSHIFFSIDSENDFSFEQVIEFINTYHLEEKLYFNLVISPWKEQFARGQFEKLYDFGMRWFNILPVYFTQSWSRENLKGLSTVMKNILDLSLKDSSLRLYGFKENLGYDTSLANNTIFIDVDGEVYFSDLASTFSGKALREDLYLWNIEGIDLWVLSGYSFEKEKNVISFLEQKIYDQVQWQRELHQVMDYFSHYLGQKNG